MYENSMVLFLYVTQFILYHLLYSYMSFLYVTWSCNLSKLYNATLYSHVSFLYVTWSCNLSKLYSATFKKTISTKLGGNTYQNEMVQYLHVTKVIKARPTKVSLIKGTHLNWPYDLWLYVILTNEESIWQLLQKLLGIKLGRKKTQNIIYLFLVSHEILWSMLHPEMN